MADQGGSEGKGQSGTEGLLVDYARINSILNRFERFKHRLRARYFCNQFQPGFFPSTHPTLGALDGLRRSLFSISRAF